jgi:carbon starvation protein CstA
MVAEGIVALIWAMAGMSFFGGVQELNNTVLVQKMDYATIVNFISETLLGRFGAILAVLGVVAAPITSGDTAFRSARLIVGDIFKFDQRPIKNRLLLSAPLFAVGYVLTQIDFSVIWRYMTWSNQTLAAIVLWAVTSYLMAENKKYWVALVPAIFMTGVCTMYMLVAPEGLRLDYDISLMITGVVTLAICFQFYRFKNSRKVQFEAS